MLTGKKYWLLLVAMVILAGCGVTDATKKVVVLDGLAANQLILDAEKLKPHVTSEEGLSILGIMIRRAHAIKAGSALLEKTLGSPSEQPTYSLDNHEKWIAVAVSEEERNAFIIDSALGAMETAAKWAGGVVTGLGFLGVIVANVRKARQLSATQTLLELKEKTLGVFVRGIQKSERDGTPAAAEIAKEADHADMKSEVHDVVLAKKDPSVVTVSPVPVVEYAPAPEPVPAPAS